MSEQDHTIATAKTSETERARRSRALKGAHAAFNHEYSAVPCTLRDESETGAKLQFDDGWWVPDHFTLFVDIDGYKVDCKKIWHKGNTYGVHFTSPRIESGMARRQTVQAIGFNDAQAGFGRASQAESSEPSFASRPRRLQPRAFGKLGQGH